MRSDESFWALFFDQVIEVEKLLEKFCYFKGSRFQWGKVLEENLHFEL